MARALVVLRDPALEGKFDLGDGPLVLVMDSDTGGYVHSNERADELVLEMSALYSPAVKYSKISLGEEEEN